MKQNERIVLLEYKAKQEKKKVKRLEHTVEMMKTHFNENISELVSVIEDLQRMLQEENQPVKNTVGFKQFKNEELC
tara:strand:- start:1055 stop:1282 length:228 start_codon:yes stop_codon:yes gene_type:complete